MEKKEIRHRHIVNEVRFESDLLVLTIDGKEMHFKLSEISPLLEKASKREWEIFEISSSGYGIHWPLLDEDLSIDGLLGIVHSPQKEKKSA